MLFEICYLSKLNHVAWTIQVKLETLVASEAHTQATEDLLELQHRIDPGHWVGRQPVCATRCG